VIKDAELVEQGTHESLLALNGVYAEMQRIQAPEGAKITIAKPAARSSASAPDLLPCRSAVRSS